MKVSIITLHTIKNYGSVLQTYATQRKFEQMGVQVEFVDYCRKSALDQNLLQTYLSDSKRWNRNFLTRFVYKVVMQPSLRRIIRVFNDFVKRNIHLTPQKYLSIEELKKDPPEADVYCTGSDQVWNSYWNRGIEEPYFLEYVPKGKKCFSYAASFGKTKLDDDEKAITKQLLEKYSAISMRESSGVQILNDLGISGSIQILDPTLILEAEEWKKLMASRQIRKKYLLIYQLNKNHEMDLYAKRLAQMKGLKLIRLSYDYHHILKPGRLICCPEVEKWLSLFYYADHIVTDSFHGTAFSIQFKKQFSVFYPPRFSGRLESILQLTGLKNRVVIDSNDFSLANQFIDYRPIDQILAKERKKADAFIAKALEK
jgi:hypothetical protein